MFAEELRNIVSEYNKVTKLLDTIKNEMIQEAKKGLLFLKYVSEKELNNEIIQRFKAENIDVMLLQSKKVCNCSEHLYRDECCECVHRKWTYKFDWSIKIK